MLALSLRLAVSVLTAVLLQPAASQPRQLTFEDRVRAQEAIERVYYSHQIGATKPFEEAVPREVLEKKVRTYLKQSVALEKFWNTPVTADSLGRELERMTRGTRMPERLRELYAALDNDPLFILECLARPTLVDRLTRTFFAFDERIHGATRKDADDLHRHLANGEVDPLAEHPRRTVMEFTRDADGTRLDSPSEAKGPVSRRADETIVQTLSPEEFDRWTEKLPGKPGDIGSVVEERDDFLVQLVLKRETNRVRAVSYRIEKKTWDDWWAEIGEEFLVEEIPDAGLPEADFRLPAPRGARTDLQGVPTPAEIGQIRGSAATETCPPDDIWSAGSGIERMANHTSVWTGSLILSWGGPYTGSSRGYVLNPLSGLLLRIASLNEPISLFGHTAVWTGNLMVVWGGEIPTGRVDTGGRYDPLTDSWTPTATSGAPLPRGAHVAVWTGSEMVVWGGCDSSCLSSGGRYDPVRDEWSPISAIGAPQGTYESTAVWTGSSMLVWGGSGNSGLDLGGRYSPSMDTWFPMSAQNAPEARYHHTAIWTGKSMIVWGGYNGSVLNTGGQYDPGTDSWTPTTASGAPPGRFYHTAVWTGNHMIVWGGALCGSAGQPCANGGRYRPGSDSWQMTSMTNAPEPRYDHTAVWTGTHMVIWGGVNPGYGGSDNFASYSSDYSADADEDGFSVCGGDCDDTNPAVRPGVAEVCNGVDDNCNGPVDEDADGVDSDSDGVHNACDNCRFAINPTQADSDKDRIGNSCDNCLTTYNPGQEDVDADQRGNICDNCPTEANTLQDDTDADRVGDVCDNCIFEQNTDQADLDIDLEGDQCDLDDGLILLDMSGASGVEYQLEQAYDSFNLYRGSLGVLRSAGLYTQDPLAVADAAQFCYETAGSLYDPAGPAPGQIVFYLVTGVGPAGESNLGTNSSGGVRPNNNPCQ